MPDLCRPVCLSVSLYDWGHLQSHPHPSSNHELLLVRLNHQQQEQRLMAEEQSKTQKAATTFAVK